MTRTIATLALLVSVLFVAPAAHAQGSDAARRTAARSLFQEGVELARQGDYPAAIDRFRRAQALRPAAPIAYNLAAALVHEGQLVEASDLIERLLRDPTIPADMRASAERQRALIAPRLSRLTVRLDGDPSGVRVEIDARELPEAMIGVPLPIDPGAHEVRAIRDGSDVASERVEMDEGDGRELVLRIPVREVVREAPAVAAASAGERGTDVATAAGVTEPVDSGGGDDALVITLAVVGGVLVAGAIAATAVALTSSESPMPVMGNTMPGVLTW